MTASKKNLDSKIKELESLLEFFQNDNIDIDEGLKNYEVAMKLASEIADTLKGYKTKINEIKLKYELNDE